ncbi:cell division control protein 45 [Capronia epimyces CBS 606.96]|uniref:Cell division control protein 45 n=1 Tax=Capronia epimyces CBS 606.96 TaxID=1182542 RepID=W9YKN6_9EURO|nr:cell division control protein 45 [Capronia epimyces CBS 606.96]EXJ82819.1 cell division control protein 45 [Capronia epimyces CBS 606.96]
MYLPRPLISHLYTNLVRSHHPLSPPVLLLVALEPDSLCACRILTSLLKRDYIPHKIQPVSGYADLSKAGEELVRPMKTTEGGGGGVVICLGVGALVDLGAILGLEDEDSPESMCGVEVWVLDARRPWNLSNVFGGQPTESPLGEVDVNTRHRHPGVDKGCIQKSYKSGKGGVIVFDDGDIMSELDAERHAYYELVEMPEIEENDSDEEDDEEEDSQDTSSSRKRKSWSDRENEDDESDGNEDEERPRQRRRSNSGSSIASTPRSKTPSSSQPTSPMSKEQPGGPPPAKQLRKRLRKLRHRHELVLEEYRNLGTSYSEPVSTLAYSLAADLGREDNDILWLAIIGTTSLELSGHTSTGLGTSTTTPALPHEHHKSWRSTRSSQTYALLRDEVRRLNPPPADQSPSISPGAGATSSPSDTSIRLSPDPRFLLLRHWSLYDSMLHSPYLASRLHVWNESGIKRLHKLLAKMGVSLSQCKQTYTHMDMDLKKTLRERLLKYAAVYGLNDLIPSGSGRATYEQEGWGFIRSWGWKAQLSAVDVGVILAAILDVGPSQVSGTTGASATYNGSSQAIAATEEVLDRSEALLPRFFAAYDALAPNHPNHLLASIPAAQHLLRSILRAGSSLLVKHQIRHLRAFRMGVVKDGPDLALFANSPGALVKLALWVGEAVAVNEREKKGPDSATPLVLAALDEARGTYMVVGTGGGIGSGEDLEARKEKAERKAKKEADRAQKRKIRDEKKAARAAQRELNGDDSDLEDDTESESEADSDSSSDEEDEAELAKKRKRGYGHNRFGIAFQEVVEETNARVKIDSFDHCIVEVKKEDLGGFLEGLSLKAVVGR